MKRISFHHFADYAGMANAIICCVDLIYSTMIAPAEIQHLPLLKYTFISIAFLSIHFSLENQNRVAVALFLWIFFWLLLVSLFFIAEYRFFKYTGCLACLAIAAGHIWTIYSSHALRTDQVSKKNSLEKNNETESQSDRSLMNL